jgi:NAD(P)-dependent dehydrogenase (short-subunit alcohol dehydrogenase family)
MGEVMIVTGGGRGIGAATARLAAVRGYAVCVNYRSDHASAESLVAEIEAAGGRATAVAGDIGVETDVTALFRACDAALGPVSALVNNAATPGAGRCRVEDMTGERVGRLMAVNLVGTILCCREAIRRMSTKRGGTGGAIVNVSSASARLGAPNLWVDYAASKGGVDTLTIGLAQEVAEEAIRVNGVRPGLIDTEIHAAAGMPDRVERAARHLPMKRAGRAEEVAAAILWLLSSDASYVSGAVLDVAGAR